MSNPQQFSLLRESESHLQPGNGLCICILNVCGPLWTWQGMITTTTKDHNNMSYLQENVCVCLYKIPLHFGSISI